MHGSAGGIDRLFRGADVTSPLAQLFYEAMKINVILAVFNLIPLPPLDGSHVIRHFLSYNALRTYDRIGYFGLVIVMFVLPLVGFPVISILISPFLQFFDALLNALLRV